MQETQEVGVLPLRQEDPLENIATYCLGCLAVDILAWIIPWTEESVGLQSIGSQRVGHD